MCQDLPRRLCVEETQLKIFLEGVFKEYIYDYYFIQYH